MIAFVIASVFLLLLFCNSCYQSFENWLRHLPVTEDKLFGYQTIRISDSFFQKYPLKSFFQITQTWYKTLYLNQSYEIRLVYFKSHNGYTQNNSRKNYLFSVKGQLWVVKILEQLFLFLPNINIWNAYATQALR